MPDRHHSQNPAVGGAEALARIEVAVDGAGVEAVGRRGAVAAITTAEVEAVLHATGADLGEAGLELLADGVAASPGVGTGALYTSAEAALAAFDRGEDVVLVADHTTPADEPVMRLAAALVTSSGGMASHAAVIARTVAVPAVCGVVTFSVEATGVRVGDRLLPEGTVITVDGAAGEVRLGGDPNMARPVGLVELPPALSTLLAWADGIAAGRPAVWANADRPEDVRRARAFGAVGVGLVRLEHLLTEDRRALLQDVVTEGSPGAAGALGRLLEEDLRRLLDAADGLPVTVRLLDAPAHEFLEDPAWREQNPMLGVRGVRLTALRPGLLEAQVRALCGAIAARRAEGAPADVRLLVPMVSDPAEVAPVWDVLRATAEAAGIPEPPLGVMVETPRAALLAGVLAHQCSHLAFGTNDLTQCTYALSRDDVAARLLPTYRRLGVFAEDPFVSLDPHGVGRLIGLAVAEAAVRRPDITTSMCGEHGGDPSSIALARRLRLDAVSCTPWRVPVARLAAAHAALEG